MLIKIKQDNMKKGLMQTDPMTGMPVAQPGSTPMFPVSQGANGGSMARFNPMINQYAQADPLANAAYASQPMPALAQTMSLEKKETVLSPKQGSIGTPAPKEGVKTGVIRPTMSIEMVTKPLPADTATKTYNVMTQGRRLEKLLSQAPDAGINIYAGKAAGGTLKQAVRFDRERGLKQTGEYPRTGEFYSKEKTDYSNAPSKMIPTYERNRKINKINLMQGRGPNLDSLNTVNPTSTSDALKEYYTGPNWKSDIKKSTNYYNRLTEEEKRKL